MVSGILAGKELVPPQAHSTTLFKEIYARAIYFLEDTVKMPGVKKGKMAFPPSEKKMRGAPALRCKLSALENKMNDDESISLHDLTVMRAFKSFMEDYEWDIVKKAMDKACTGSTKDLAHIVLAHLTAGSHQPEGSSPK
eukprot:12406357-Karenia_brevis.AAC.1